MTARLLIGVVICVVCGQPVDPDDAHWPHQAGCTRHDCDCDLPTCPGCCPCQAVT